MKLKKITLFLLPFALALNAQGENTTLAEPHKNVITFSTDVIKEVDYDLMEVALFVKQEGKNLKDVNHAINEKVNVALALIKQQSGVEIKQNSRNTQVRYDNKGKQSGWVARADLVLESKDFILLSQLISDLNETFAIAQVSQKLSKNAAAMFEDDMIKAALNRFQHKAEVIQTALNAKSYRIINLRFDGDNEFGFDRRLSVKPMGKLMAYVEQTTDEVNLENQGKAELKTTVNAEIELLN